MKYSALGLSAALIFAAILVGGCANSFGTAVSGSRTNNDVIPRTNVGGKGVEVFWLNNAPPDVVQKNARFQIGIELQNKGFQDVEEGILRAWGCKSVQLEGSGVVNGVYSSTFDLRKSDINNLAGGMTRKYLSARALDAEDSCYIHAQACYIYQTHASQQICIDPEPYSESSAKACEFSEEVSVPTQGAPVVVDKIKTGIVAESAERGTATFQFMIYVKNAGTGQVVADDALEAVCNGAGDSESLERINIVKMDARIGTLPLRCEPDELVLTQDLEKRLPFTCTYEVSKDRGVFPTVLALNLYYGYIQGSEVDVKIEGEKNEKFRESPFCPPDNCKERGVWGVCDIFGGFDENRKCEDSSKVCCREALPKCERENSGYKCLPESECPNWDRDKVNSCPGAERCCRVSS
ncbi:hypothetical protein D6764_02875 [Candidatus Woesearchaeota archaeon]|nr:MAG: hypothetical protein D6764_02875 [Candidatus Woesearchaeota archaeon]